MPPLTSIAIPVISLSSSQGDRPTTKGKAPLRQKVKPRTYKDEPLPIRPSDIAPKGAKIVGRISDESGVAYQLKIGEIELNDVGIDEILDYVSALELEQYEHRQFAEERQVLKVVEDEKIRRKQEKLERMKERAKRKGIASSEIFSSSTGGSDEGEDATGKHGRPRPTYTHLYKKPKERRRRKRDPETGELMSLSDESGIDIQVEGVVEEGQSSQDEHTGGQSSGPLAELPKRRRRKRDKVTGQLLPLSPVAQQPTGQEMLERSEKLEKSERLEQSERLEEKRQRRRRHPQTGVLMPLGWRYSSNEAKATHEDRQAGLGSPSFKRLSISQEHGAKRQKLDIGSSVSRSVSPIPTKADIAAQLSQRSQVTLKPASQPSRGKATIVELLSTDSEEQLTVATTTGNNLKPIPKARSASVNSKGLLQSVATSSAESSSPDLEIVSSFVRPSKGKALAATSSIKPSQETSSRRKQQATTSILNPSATRASSTEPPAMESEMDEPEWLIEGILGHHMSDPKTHPEELGKVPVMLYQVKWEGHEKPTWEPVESFGDQSIIVAYRRQAKLPPDLSIKDLEIDNDITMTAAPSTGPEARPTAGDNADDSEDDYDEDGVMQEDEYEVEQILAHHLSDPKTHPTELGQTPVMLYQVKWKGWDNLTWEPASSFADAEALKAYHKRENMKPVRAANDADTIMID